MTPFSSITTTLIDGGAGYDSIYVDDSQGPAGVHLALAGTNVEFVYGGVGNDVINAPLLACPCPRGCCKDEHEL